MNQSFQEDSDLTSFVSRQAETVTGSSTNLEYIGFDPEG